MFLRLAAAVGLLVLGALALLADGNAVAENRCAEARRTCKAFCLERRGDSPSCHKGCSERYRQCRRTGWFVWGPAGIGTGSGRRR
ncbi:MAG: hypothetical protein ACR2PO_15985 [Methyloligellaceae bacterium]